MDIELDIRPIDPVVVSIPLTMICIMELSRRPTSAHPQTLA